MSKRIPPPPVGIRSWPPSSCLTLPQYLLSLPAILKILARGGEGRTWFCILFKQRPVHSTLCPHLFCNFGLWALDQQWEFLWDLSQEHDSPKQICICFCLESQSANNQGLVNLQIWHFVGHADRVDQNYKFLLRQIVFSDYIFQRWLQQ